MMAFDGTYLQNSLNQMLWQGQRCLVGGSWSPTNPDNAHPALDHELDVKNIKRTAAWGLEGWNMWKGGSMVKRWR